jgi:3-dehydroquinate dehydratase/shikimate dehydrogenase
VSREVVHSVLEETPEAAARTLAAAPAASALIELRADHLRAGDVAGLVRRAGRAVIATVRTVEDGGRFDGSTEEKRAILHAALDAGAAFADIEWDGPLRDTAFGPHAARTILSHHGAPCDEPMLAALFGAMAGTKASRLKIVPRAERALDVRAVFNLLGRAKTERRDLCSFATGPSGSFSRIAALRWGSWGTYGASERGRETGDGQLPTRDMLEVYRVLELEDETRWLGLFGASIAGSPSPAIHAAGYRALSIDAVYVPIETADIEEAKAIAAWDGLLPLGGFGVTIPLKEAAAARCARLDISAASGSANTIVCHPDGWEGFNTDAPGGPRADPKARRSSGSCGGDRRSRGHGARGGCGAQKGGRARDAVQPDRDARREDRARHRRRLGAAHGASRGALGCSRSSHPSRAPW